MTAPSPALSETLSVIRRYQYNETYQLKILALLVRYPHFIHRYGEVVRPEYFEYSEMTMICRQILDFFRRYAVVPTRDSFIAWIMDYEQKAHLPPKIVADLTSLVENIFVCDMSDGDSVRDTAVDFAKRQSLKAAVMNIVSNLEKFDDSYERAHEDIMRALMVGQGLGSLGTEVFGTIPSLASLIAQDSPYASIRKIPTPFNGLNEARKGGLGPGELIVINGPSGAGKSHIMNNFAVLATHYSRGQWIAHATLELTELDNHLRYGARILGISMDDIVLNAPEFIEACTHLAPNSRIFVKWFPPGQTHMGHIRSWISALSSELGVGPCMILIDYPDLMIPIKGATDNLYTNGAHIYNETLTLIHDYPSVGVVSSQLGRDSQNSGKARSDSIANSIAKVYNADVIGTINQSEEDQTAGVGMMWWDKVRRGRGKFPSYYRIDYAKSHVFEDDSVQELFTRGRGSNKNQNNPQNHQAPHSSAPDIPMTSVPFAPPPGLA